MFFYPSVKSFTSKQIEAENRDRNKQWGHKERDSLLSYMGERKKIIAQYARGLSDDEVEQIAKAARGLMHQDIIKVVDRYLEYDELPRLIEHSTNTCDPYTGSWTEHLMNPDYLVEMFTLNGFNAEMCPLYWQEAGGSLVKKLARKLLNLGISVSKTPLYFSPAYAICARYEGPRPTVGHQHKYHMYKCHRSYLWWYLMMPVWELGSYALFGRLVKPHR